MSLRARLPVIVRGARLTRSGLSGIATSPRYRYPWWRGATTVNVDLRFTWWRRYGQRADRAGSGGLVPIVGAGWIAGNADGWCDRHRSGGASEKYLAVGRFAGDCRPRGGRLGAGPGFLQPWARDNPGSGRASRLAGEWGDPHAARHKHACAAGSGGSLSRPPRGRFLSFPGTQRRPCQILRSDGIRTSLFAKRLERGRFQWPMMPGGAVAILSQLLTPVHLYCRGDAQLRRCHDRVAVRQSHPLHSRSDHCRDCGPSL